MTFCLVQKPYLLTNNNICKNNGKLVAIPILKNLPEKQRNSLFLAAFVIGEVREAGSAMKEHLFLLHPVEEEEIAKGSLAAARDDEREKVSPGLVVVVVWIMGAIRKFRRCIHCRVLVHAAKIVITFEKKPLSVSTVTFSTIFLY